MFILRRWLIKSRLRAVISSVRNMMNESSGVVSVRKYPTNNEICRLLLDSLCIVASGIHTRCLSVTKWFFPLASIWSVPESIYIIWCLLCECGLSSISSLPVILVRISQSGIFSISESRFSFHELSGANCIVYVFLCKSGTNVNK